MKTLTLMLFLVCFVPAIAQETTPTTSSQDNTERVLTKGSDIEGSVMYALNTEEFIFTPEATGYKISKIENGKEIEYGTLLMTTDDGYFVLTSNINDHVCYGRFDDSGNFRALRYDEKSDAVIEENFMLASK